MSASEKQPRRPKGSGALYKIQRTAWNEYTQSTEVINLYQAAEDITNPLDPFTRKRITGTGHTTQQAKARLEKSKARFYRKIGMAQVGVDISRRSGSLTLSQYFDQWYSNLHPNRVSNSKKLKYRGNFTNHILPALGNTYLEDITFEQLNTLIHVTLPAKKKIVNGSVTDDRLLGQNSITNIYWSLNNCLTTAFNEGRIPRNPLKLVDTPRFAAPTENIPYFMHIVEGMFARMKDEGDPAYERFFLSLLGLRRGERLGLSWKSITLTGPNPHMVLNQTVLREPGLGIIIKPSTKSGKDREVPLSGPFLDVLKTLKAQRRQQLKHPQFKPSDQVKDLVFLTDSGRPIDPNSDNEFWRATLKKYKAPASIRGHALRHVSATYLSDLNVGVDVAQAILGHQSVSMSFFYARHTQKKSRKDIENYGKSLEEAMARKTKKRPPEATGAS
jgi:integrase